MSGKTSDPTGMHARFQEGNGTRGVFAAILHGDRLLISEWRDQKNWNLAGGGVNDGETDEEALKREVLDETGLEVCVHAPIGSERVKDADTMQLYLCTVTGGALMATRESRYHRWVTAEDIGEVAWAGGGTAGRMARCVFDGLSMLQVPTVVSRRNGKRRGRIECTPKALCFPLAGNHALRWERLPVQ